MRKIVTGGDYPINEKLAEGEYSLRLTVGNFWGRYLFVGDSLKISLHKETAEGLKTPGITKPQLIGVLQKESTRWFERLLLWLLYRRYVKQIKKQLNATKK